MSLRANAVILVPPKPTERIRGRSLKIDRKPSSPIPVFDRSTKPSCVRLRRFARSESSRGANPKWIPYKASAGRAFRKPRCRVASSARRSISFDLFGTMTWPRASATFLHCLKRSSNRSPTRWSGNDSTVLFMEAKGRKQIKRGSRHQFPVPRPAPQCQGQLLPQNRSCLDSSETTSPNQEHLLDLL